MTIDTNMVATQVCGGAHPVEKAKPAGREIGISDKMHSSTRHESQHSKAIE
jgi:hypothetical protein